MLAVGIVDVVIDARRPARQVGPHFAGKDPIAQALGFENVALAARKADGQCIVIPCVEADQVLDPTGCGDAYRSGLLYGIVNGFDWLTTGRLAAVMGAIKIAHRGGQNHQPSREEIAARYQRAFGSLPW